MNHAELQPEPWTKEEKEQANCILDDLWSLCDKAGIDADERTWTYQSQWETVPFERWANRVARVTETLKGKS